MNEGRKTPRSIPKPSGAVQSAIWHDQHRYTCPQFPKRSPFYELHKRLVCDICRRRKDPLESEIQALSPVEQTTEVAQKTGNNRSLMQSKDNQSFNRKVRGTIETVGHQTVAEHHVPNYLVNLERDAKIAIAELQHIASEYHPLTVWEDIKLSLDKLDALWAKVKEAVNDLKFYVPMVNAEQFPEQVLSMESTTDEPSFIQGQEICATVLTQIVKDAYHAFQPYFNNVLGLISKAFREEDIMVQRSSLTGISIATRAVRLLAMLKEVERQVDRIGDEKYRIELSAQFFNQRKENIKKLLDEMCRHLESLHRSLFQSKHLYVKGKHAIAKFKSMADILRSCWKEAALLVRHLRKILPDVREFAHEKVTNLLCHAGSLLAEMQDSPDVQAFVSESEPIEYEDAVVDDIVQAQLWLLPCLDDLITIASTVCVKIKAGTRDGTKELSETALQQIHELKTVMYNVVLMAIARASWLITWTIQSPTPRLEALKEQGTQSLLLVLNYNQGELSLRCAASSPKEDMHYYAIFVYSTNTLRNGVLQVHGMIRKETEIAVALGTTSAPIFRQETEELDIVQFHKIKGMQFLVPKFSLKAFPVDLEGSLESELSGLKPESTSLARQLEDLAVLEEATITSEDDLPIPRPALSPSVNSEGGISACSVELETGFAALPPSGSTDQVPTRPLNISLEVDVTPQKAYSGPSRVSPFVNQMPTSGLPTPVSNNAESFDTDGEHLESSGTAQMNRRTYSVGSTEPSEGIQNVSAADLTDGRLIGKGAGGTVFRMSYNPRPVAVKIMNDATLRTKEKFKKETRLHRRLSKHPNIVEFVGTCPEFQQEDDSPGQSLVMIMELCDLGDLFKILCEARWVQDKKNFKQDITEYMSSRGYMIYSNWALRVQVACDITAGMSHMHSQGIVHRDLTSYNVVLKRGDEGEWIAKVCDFERSREIPESGFIPRSDTFANSPAWAAPEIIDNRDYSTQADVYSMGIILWELVTLQEPNELYMDLMRSERVGSHETRRLLLLEKLTELRDEDLPEYSRLAAEIKQCLSDEGNNRPTMNDLHHSLLEIKKSITTRASLA
eukprot:g7638.t1